MLARLWRFCCSLKLTIVLASAATLMLIGGSLLLPAHPRLFAGLDAQPMGEWLRTTGATARGLTWWIPVAGVLMALLGLNTACCFLDWLPRLRSRWRKTGEYLIHLGFVLVLTGYFWGSVAGTRHEGVRIGVGQTAAVPGWPGHYLRLEALEPRFVNGRPMDMQGELVLLRGETELARAETRANHPLRHGALVAFPTSLGQTATGFRVRLPGGGSAELIAGSIIDLPDGRRLRVLDFHPQTLRLPNGAFIRGGDELVDPAFRLELTGGGERWQGWFRLIDGLPAPLAAAGVFLQPVEPLYRRHGILTVNRDPGAGLAAAGGSAMAAGTLFALFSFYAKRARGDRPEIF